MPKFREFVFGPWRAVAVLGVTQILAWGALFYPPVLMMPLVAVFCDERVLARVAGRGVLRTYGRRPHRPPRRPCGHVRRRIARRARTGLSHAGVTPGRLPRDLDRSWPRDLGDALRSGLCDA